MTSLRGLFKALIFQRKLRKRLAEGWTYEKIEPMSTKKIFARLRRLGIKTTQKDFLRVAQRYDSAERLSEEEWYSKYTLRPEGRYDEDFPTAEACDVWWQTWEWVKEKVTPERNTLEAFDEAFRGTQFVFNLIFISSSTQRSDIQTRCRRTRQYSVSWNKVTGTCEVALEDNVSREGHCVLCHQNRVVSAGHRTFTQKVALGGIVIN